MYILRAVWLITRRKKQMKTRLNNWGTVPRQITEFEVRCDKWIGTRQQRAAYKNWHGKNVTIDIYGPPKKDKNHEVQHHSVCTPVDERALNGGLS
jgi:hypothetical protein